MSGQHTPGPWKWWTSNSYRRLTALGQQDGGVLSAVSVHGDADVRVSEADARLIAAAPVLLAAAKEVRSHMVGRRPTRGYLLDNDESRAALARLVDAITEASGE